MSAESCAICGANDWELAYEGLIRVGGPGRMSREPRRVLRCKACSTGRLTGNAKVDYESAEYRELVDGDTSVERYYSLHDPEQSRKIELIGVEEFRNKVVADIGCGAGSFLDVVKGLSSATIGVEPASAYHSVLSAQGHAVFPYCKDVGPEWVGRVDLAVCFSVVEHVSNPVELLTDIRRLLKPGGTLILSTPNSKEWLLDLLPAEYGSFFFRAVHQWYFDEHSLEVLATRAGFTRSEFQFVHRFDLSNFLLWLRDKKSTGLGKIAVPSPVDATFCRWLEDNGKADYIYATLTSS